MMDANPMYAAIVRHLDVARAEAAEFRAAGCFGLARCRDRDGAYLQHLLAGASADVGRSMILTEAR